MASVYYGWLGLTGGAPAHEAEKFAGKLVIAGFAIFCLLFSASYTGSTAAILIAETGKRSTITGLQDIASMPGGKLCMMLASKHRFVLQYPQFDVSSQGYHLSLAESSREFQRVSARLLRTGPDRDGRHGGRSPPNVRREAVRRRDPVPVSAATSARAVTGAAALTVDRCCEQ